MFDLILDLAISLNKVTSRQLLVCKDFNYCRLNKFQELTTSKAESLSFNYSYPNNLIEFNF